MSGPFCLKKSLHCDTVLDQLFKDDVYADVTLTAEGQSIKAHKNILSLSSSYFQQVLMRDQNVQTVIVFRDMKFSELKNLIKFIYVGEAIVDVNELKSFMEMAQLLKIYSLLEPHADNSSGVSSDMDEKSSDATKRLSGTVCQEGPVSNKKFKVEPDPAEGPLENGDSLSKCVKVEPEASFADNFEDESPVAPSTSHSKTDDEQSLAERLAPTDEERWMSAEEHVNDGGFGREESFLLPNFTMTPLMGSNSDSLSNFPPLIPPDGDPLACLPANLSTYSRGRSYPSPAQENIRKLILRTEDEVNDLMVKINAETATTDERHEFELKRSAIASYKKLLRNKINAARRSMKSREKKKQLKTQKSPIYRANPFRAF